MTQQQWTAVDAYINEHTGPQDPALEAALHKSRAAGLPEIYVAPNQGQFLMLLAMSIGAQRILEVGTLGGYSTIFLARALPTSGQLISLELDAHHAEIARQNIAHAGLAEQVELRVGPALQSLEHLAAEKPAPFDLVFVDADKENAAGYFEWALKLTRPGSLIIVDNVVREGVVIDADSSDSYVQGMRRFYERLAAEPSVSATVIQTVGIKGHDGFAIALVKS